jgi:hypothetical protein
MMAPQSATPAHSNGVNLFGSRGRIAATAGSEPIKPGTPEATPPEPVITEPGIPEKVTPGPSLAEPVSPESVSNGGGLETRVNL